MRKIIIGLFLFISVNVFGQATFTKQYSGLPYIILNPTYEHIARGEAVSTADSCNIKFYKSSGGEWQIDLYSKTGVLLFRIDSAGCVHITDDTKLYFGATDDVSLEYDEDGNNDLSIVGPVRIDSLLNIDHIKANSAQGLLLTEDGGNGIFIEDGGNVGIGTDSPDVPLEVKGNLLISDNTWIYIDYKDLDGATGDANDMWRTAMDNSGNFVIRSVDDDAADENIVSIDFDAPADRLVIDSSGQVGIGTADPDDQTTIIGATPILTLTDSDVNTVTSTAAQQKDTSAAWIDASLTTPTLKTATSTGRLSSALLVCKVTFTKDSTSAFNVITLPAEAIIKDIYVNITTGFTGTGTDLLDIGVTGTGDHFKNNLDVSGTGWTTAMDGNIPTKPGATSVIAQYFDANADADAGAGEIYVYYSIH